MSDNENFSSDENDSDNETEILSQKEESDNEEEMNIINKKKDPSKKIEKLIIDSDSDEDENKEDDSEYENNEEDEDVVDDEVVVEDEDDDSSVASSDKENVEEVASTKGKKEKQTTASKSQVQLETSDEEDDDNDDDDTQYLQKFNSEINKNYIMEHHPECVINNYDEISSLTSVIRDKNNNIIDDLHRTIPYLTKYERARILGQRSKQINSGAKVFVKVPENIIDGYLIAQLELEQKRIPFIIKRPIPGGGCEYWNLKDLEIVGF
jgi:DNA-directed RNA polymerase I, II, and III subunit RPABC2